MSVTTIIVQIPNCAPDGNTLASYTSQFARTVNGRRVTELQGTLTLRPNIFGTCHHEPEASE